MAQIPLELEETQFRHFYADHLPQLQAACERVVSTVRALVEAAPGLEISKVEGRVKDVEECIRKFRRKYRAALEERNTPYEIQHWITDLIGVRVVCLYEDEIEKVAHLMQSHFDVIEVTDKVAAVESTEAEFGYNLSRNLEAIRPEYSFETTAAASVPEAIIAFLESFEFEEAIRNAISLGGDADTQACIAGALAEAFYKKIPTPIATATIRRLPLGFIEIVDAFYASI